MAGADRGVFNFEGGCYAKVIRLSREAEPEIYATTSRFGTVLENVVLDPRHARLDFDDDQPDREHARLLSARLHPERRAERHRRPPEERHHADRRRLRRAAADRQARPTQAMYHFLSGYTAQVAGTETGVTEPQATFSTCFGAPFMPRHPAVYAKMLGELIAPPRRRLLAGQHRLVGRRLRRRAAHGDRRTRARCCGPRSTAGWRRGVCSDPHFGLLVPSACPDVPGDVLDPRTPGPTSGLRQAARDVAAGSQANFRQFEPSSTARQAGAIRAAA